MIMLRRSSAEFSPGFSGAGDDVPTLEELTAQAQERASQLPPKGESHPPATAKQEAGGEAAPERLAERIAAVRAQVERHATEYLQARRELVELLETQKSLTLSVPAGEGGHPVVSREHPALTPVPEESLPSSAAGHVGGFDAAEEDWFEQGADPEWQALEASWDLYGSLDVEEVPAQKRLKFIEQKLNQLAAFEASGRVKDSEALRERRDRLQLLASQYTKEVKESS